MLKMGDEGLEPVVPENAVTVQDRIELWQTEQVAAESGGAESGAVGAEGEVVSVPDDPRLLGIIDAWPTLSEDTRDAITSLSHGESGRREDVVLASDVGPAHCTQSVPSLMSADQKGVAANGR